MPKTIIFTRSKDLACKIAYTLQQSAVKKNYVGVYHASLTQHTKRVIQEGFSSATSSLRCLVATVAFGMVCRIATLPGLKVCQHDFIYWLLIFPIM